MIRSQSEFTNLFMTPTYYSQAEQYINQHKQQIEIMRKKQMAG